MGITRVELARQLKWPLASPGSPDPGFPRVDKNPWSATTGKRSYGGHGEAACHHGLAEGRIIRHGSWLYRLAMTGSP